MRRKSIQKNKKVIDERTFDTKIGVIESDLNVDLGVRRDMKLGNYLISKGYKSLASMLKA